jgi:hypothetical protein
MTVTRGIYTDGAGNHSEVPLKVDADGTVVTSGGGGTVAAIIQLGAIANFNSVASNAVALPANSARKYFEFQNASDVDMWLNFGAVAGVGAGFLVPAKQNWYAPVGTTVVAAINVFCAVAAKPYAILAG